MLERETDLFGLTLAWVPLNECWSLKQVPQLARRFEFCDFVFVKQIK